MANTHRKAAFIDGVTVRGEGAMHGAPPAPEYGQQIPGERREAVSVPPVNVSP